MSTLPPQPPQGPDGPETEGAPGLDVLERVREQRDPGDEERYAHYVRKDKIAAAAVTGRPVVALCGKVWTPGRDPSKYPVCPTCKSIYEEMRNGEGSGDGKGPRFPRFPFGRGGR